MQRGHRQRVIGRPFFQATVGSGELPAVDHSPRHWLSATELNAPTCLMFKTSSRYWPIQLISKYIKDIKSHDICSQFGSWDPLEFKKQRKAQSSGEVLDWGYWPPAQKTTLKKTMGWHGQTVASSTCTFRPWNLMDIWWTLGSLWRPVFSISCISVLRFLKQQLTCIPIIGPLHGSLRPILISYVVRSLESLEVEISPGFFRQAPCTFWVALLFAAIPSFNLIILTYIKGCRPCRRPRKKLFGASNLEAFDLFPMYIVVKYIW